MKYRVRLDLSFEKESDAQVLMDYARGLTSKAVSINEGRDNEEISFCDMEICRHDEGLPCTRLNRVEVKRMADKPVEPTVEREPFYGIPATEASNPAPAPKLVRGLPAGEADIFDGLEIYTEGNCYVFTLGGNVVRRKNPATGVTVLCSMLGLGNIKAEVITTLKDMPATPNRNRLLDILEGKK